CRRSQRVVTGNHHGANAHRAEMVETLTHSALDDVCQGDHPEHAPILSHQEGRAASIGNVGDALLGFVWHLVATLRDIFRYRFRSTFADLQPIEVDAGHSRLSRKGNESRVAITELPSAQAIFFFSEDNDRTTLGRFI